MGKDWGSIIVTYCGLCIRERLNIFLEVIKGYLPTRIACPCGGTQTVDWMELSRHKTATLAPCDIC